MDQGVSVASNPAYDPLDDGDSVKYELPRSDPFSVSNPVYQDHEPSSDMLKGDHEYDYIPAMFTDGQQRPISGSSHPFAKAGGIPQISHPSMSS